MSDSESNENILCITDNLSSGGAQRVSLTIARNVCERKRLGCLYLLNPLNVAYEDEARHLPVRGLLGFRWNKFLYPVCFLSFWRILLRRKTTVVFSTLLASNLVAVIAGRLLFKRPKIIIREANTLYLRAQNMGGQAMVLFYAARVFYRLADVVVAPSRGVADDLVRHVKVPAHKIRVIYNPSVTAVLFDQMQEDVEHPYLNLMGSPLYVAAGRLTIAKGFDVLLTAFALLCKKRPEARLIVLGEGPERRALEKMRDDLGLQDSVDFPGFVRNPFSYMKMADVFVLSSRWEGLPNVLIQAIACGVTVVSTNCPSGPDEILDGGKYGYLVSVENPVELSEKMIYASNHPIDIKLLDKCAETFDEVTILNEYMELFDEVIGFSG